MCAAIGRGSEEQPEVSPEGLLDADAGKKVQAVLRYNHRDSRGRNMLARHFLVGAKSAEKQNPSQKGRHGE